MKVSVLIFHTHHMHMLTIGVLNLRFYEERIQDVGHGVCSRQRAGKIIKLILYIIQLLLLLLLFVHLVYVKLSGWYIALAFVYE